MNRTSVLFFMACLLMFAGSVSATETSSVPIGTLDLNRSEAHLVVSRTSPEFTSIALDNPNIVTGQQISDYQTYQAFGIPGEPFLPQEGAPTVPQITRFYRIPNTGSAELVLNNTDFDLVENVNALPVQPEDAAFGAISRSESIYSRDAWYPEQVAVISEPMIMRDFRVVQVTLYPVQINPVTHQARIYRHLGADLVATNEPGQNELLLNRRPSGSWANIYRSLIPNLDESALDNVTTSPGSYLIICNTSATALQFADSLFQWKTRKGMKVVVDSRASWSASTMINAIRSAYTSYDPPLEYVALMGDPESAIGVPSDGSNYDHSFALGNAGDDIEDISVGRLSGSTGAEMTVINAKIMTYERNPVMTDTSWFHKAFLYAGVANQCAGNASLMLWGEHQFETYTGVTNTTVITVNGSVDNNTVQTQINAGDAFFVWRGSWVGQMGSGLAASCAAGGRLPVTFTVTCGTGDFSSGTSISEEWLLAGNSASDLRGGVCGIGTATLSTHNPENVSLASGLMYAITNQNVEALGTALASGKAQLYNTYGSQGDPYGGTLAGNFSRYCNLMGEPSLCMWTDVPDVFTVTHPTGLNVGAHSVDVTVRRQGDNALISDAMVVLWKRSPDSTWVKGFTDSQGHVTLPVNVRQTGNMFLTVIKRNCKPYLFTIPCAQATVMPMASTWTLDDDNAGGTQGNGDHLMNPGEIIDLPVYIRNFGNTTSATVVSATISGGSGVTIVSGSSAYPNIAAGDSALGVTPFRIQVSPALQNNATVSLIVTITYSSGTTTGVIPLVCHAGQAQYMRQYLTTAFNPGTSVNLTAVLSNLGTVTMPGVNAHIVPQSAYVMATDADAYFGDIAAGALDSNSADVLTLFSSPLTFRGHQAPIQMILTASNGFVDTVVFNVSVGTATTADPTGPDAYGYYAYDNTDVNYDGHPTYLYTDISGTGTRLTLASSDIGDKTDIATTYSDVVTLPFGFKFYGTVYTQLTVCANGWVGFGNQANYDGFRNYPIPAMQAPDAMIAPYWDDLQTNGSGQGVWVRNDAASHRYIIQWKAGVGSSYSTPLDCEVILYDTTYHPTSTGNGKILVQYNTVTMNVANQYNDEAPGCTIGLQRPGSMFGLQYAYEDLYSTGAATVLSGRAILYTAEGVGASPSSLTLLSPAANAVWYQNTTTPVQWFGGTQTDHIRIDLSRSGVGGPWENIVASTANTGMYAFALSGPTSTNCFVRVASVETPAQADTSDGAFTISALRLSSPNGADVWMRDSVATITWQGGSTATGVRVELSRSGLTGPWEVLNSAAPNTGTYSLTVSGSTSANCFVRLTSLGDASDADVSDGAFSIQSIQTVFTEGFETGAAGWSHATVAPWRDEWSVSTERARTGSYSYKCGDTGTGNYLDSLDARLTSPAIANLPSGATLTFYYVIQSELSGSFADSAYDGGLLELSDNGGAFAQVTPNSGYTKRFRTTAGSGNPYRGPMPGLPCWASATETAWTQVQMDLSAYAGHSIQLRWRFGSDAASNLEGWYVDDVLITAPQVVLPDPTAPLAVTCQTSGDDVVLRWDADANVGYRIYSSDLAAGPYTTLVGTANTNSYTIVGGASSAARRFYIVVGWNGQ